MWNTVVHRCGHVRRFLLLASLFCGCVAVDLCQAQLSVVLKDAQSGDLLDVKVVAEYGSDKLEFLLKQQGTYASTGVLKASGNNLRFELLPNISYATRKIELHGSVAQRKKNYQFYLGKKLQTYTFGYLERYRAALAQGDIDRSIAALEVAYVESGLGKCKTQFDVKLKFNFARSLANACQILGYNSCEVARSLYVELKEEISEIPRIFRAEGISKESLEQTIRDMDATKVNRQYTVFRNRFEQGDYENAAGLGEGMLEQFDGNVVAFSAARLTKDRLREDVGTAYARASSLTDKGGTKVIDTALAKKALEHFRDISRESEVLSRNISDLKQRM